ncbi:MAG TPA: hypothetical protein VKA27_05025 [Sunxiuqinia sp.]|nr:hypothetical protein [Sunxiuqinia sp.]
MVSFYRFIQKNNYCRESLHLLFPFYRRQESPSSFINPPRSTNAGSTLPVNKEGEVSPGGEVGDLKPRRGATIIAPGDNPGFGCDSID